MFINIASVLNFTKQCPIKPIWNLNCKLKPLIYKDDCELGDISKSSVVIWFMKSL